MAAEQLGIVASKLIAEPQNVAPPENNAGGIKSRVDHKRELKDAIDEFHEKLKNNKQRRENDQDAVSFTNVLEEAERQQLNHPEVKAWLDDMKDVYYEVIDVCDKLQTQERAAGVRKGKQPFLCSRLDRVKDVYNACNKPQTEDGTSDQRKGRWPFLRCSQIRDGIAQMSNHILNEALPKLEKNMPEIAPRGRVLTRKKPINFVHDKDKDEKVIGRDDERRLAARILHKDERVRLITILGETGIGKTALAKRVYKCTKEDFNIATWVNFSDVFDKRRIARDFVERVTSKKINTNELDRVDQSVREIINGKSFLLVLDGVPNVEVSDSNWRDLMNVFNCGGPGCTILMTTRRENSVVATKSAYKMLLDPDKYYEDCRSIIKDQAFGTNQKKEEIANNLGKHLDELVKKCQGFPVIAKTLGVILRDRTSERDWEKVVESDIWEPDSYSTGKPHAMKATMLSYYSLPPELRQCLLYCSIFPKNEYIDVTNLISLWMAQDSFGLDQQDMEAKAWERFKELLDCSIFEEYSKEDDSGNFICKLQGVMSDLVHDLAKNECHTMTLDKTERKKEKVLAMTRHCTLNVLPQASLPASIAGSEKLHTLMLLAEYSSIDPNNLSVLLGQMGRLRALDLSYCSMEKLPTKACELLQLRYLNLSFNRDLSALPELLCDLVNLQTLNLNGCDALQELPRGIGKLAKLRHLDILWTTSLSYLPKGLTSLTSLKRLSRFFGSTGDVKDSKKDKAYCNLADLKNLNNLQGSISIEGLGGGDSDASEAAAEVAKLKKKTTLFGLELWFSVVGSGSNDGKVLEALEPPNQLESLGIFHYRGSFTEFPSWWTRLDKLTHIILSDCTKCDILPPLAKLESLKSLEIRNFASVIRVTVEFLGDKEGIYVTKNIAFQKLEKLHFERMDKWETWDAYGDDRVNHMPLLSSLSIVSCPKLKSLPGFIREKRKKKDFKAEWKDFKAESKDLFAHIDEVNQKEKGAQEQ